MAVGREAAIWEESTCAILRSARDDRQKVAELHERITPPLIVWARLRMGEALRRHVEPEELVQEVWCRVLEHLGEFDEGRASFRPWLFRVARNVLLEASRRAGSREGTPSSAAAMVRVPDSVTGPGTRAGRREAVEAFLERVQRLGEEERELVVLRGIEGRRFEDISARSGASAEAVSKRWQRLRARLCEDGIPEYLT